jgi:hypothetical protein
MTDKIFLLCSAGMVGSFGGFVAGGIFGNFDIVAYACIAFAVSLIGCIFCAA